MDPGEASVRPLEAHDLAAVGALLKERVAKGARSDLLLLDLCQQPPVYGGAHPRDPRVLGFARDGGFEQILSTRPVVVLDSRFDPGDLDPFIPFLGSLGASLLKSPERVATPLWDLLRGMGYHAEIDREEVAFAVDRASFEPLETPASGLLRPAQDQDLEALLFASRASLVEEGRLDTYPQDPRGFRAWVRGRLPRARVIDWCGEVAFVAWADVVLPEGWLVQGVYTWPDHRRRGLCQAGMSDLCREAFSRGADHVQLSVVDGNQPAIRLYERVGFRPFDQFRTVLFV